MLAPVLPLLFVEASARAHPLSSPRAQEKVSYDDNNLACIVVFPPFRQKGWATLLIEFSASSQSEHRRVIPLTKALRRL